MILYFKVANYKSINEQITINFNSTSINEHTESNLIETEKDSILKSILLYGHNASGKSTILDALVFLRWFVNNSAIEKQNNEEIKVEPFEFLESTCDRPSYFEICFLIGKNKFRYGFEADKKYIHKEWLLESKAIKEYPVFLRINQNVQVDYKRFENSNDLEKRTRKNALFLSVCSQWNVLKAQKIDEWIGDIITIHGLSDNRYRHHTLEMLKDKKYAAIINMFIKKADLGINKVDVLDIPFDEMIKTVPDDLKSTVKKQYGDKSGSEVFTVHNKYNDKKEIVGNISVSLDKSGSEGTKKYFNLVGLLVYALINNKLVIIDEFDARLHTLLSKAIIRLFNSDKIKSKAQLLVASHDTALLDRDLLRRDQIYFVEKDEIGGSTVTSLVEYKPRKDTPFDKNYLDGKYGGIPFIDDLESLIANG